MLVLTRQPQERIDGPGSQIICTMPDGREIVVTLIRLSRHTARIGIEAPRDVEIVRDDAKQKERA